MWNTERPSHWPSRRILPAAQNLVSDLEKRFPEDTAVRFSYLPTLRAVLALNHGEPSKAIELSRSLFHMNSGRLPAAFLASLGVYIRSMCVASPIWPANQGTEAAAEFQKILDHRGIVISDPIGALAHLQLGRALALSGDKARRRLPTRISLLSGKTPTPTFRSSNKPALSMQSCSNSYRDGSRLLVVGGQTRSYLQTIAEALAVAFIRGLCSDICEYRSPIFVLSPYIRRVSCSRFCGGRASATWVFLYGPRGGERKLPT